MSGKKPWTEAEDNRLIAGHTLGLTWGAIARDYLPNRSESACQNRHATLIGKRAPERKGEGGYGSPWIISNDDNAYGSKKLLEAQLRAGQYNGAARAAWLARHGVAA